MFKTAERTRMVESSKQNQTEMKSPGNCDTECFLPAVHGLVMLSWSPGLNNPGWISSSMSQLHCSRSWLLCAPPRNQCPRIRVNSFWLGCPREGGWACLYLSSCPQKVDEPCAVRPAHHKEIFQIRYGQFGLHMKPCLYSPWKRLAKISPKKNLFDVSDRLMIPERLNPKKISHTYESSSKGIPSAFEDTLHNTVITCVQHTPMALPASFKGRIYHCNKTHDTHGGGPAPFYCSLLVHKGMSTILNLVFITSFLFKYDFMSVWVSLSDILFCFACFELSSTEPYWVHFWWVLFSLHLYILHIHPCQCTSPISFVFITIDDSIAWFI